jgi:hypothetical protein
MKTIWNIIMWPFKKIIKEIKFRRKMAELRKRDPFIYK